MKSGVLNVILIVLGVPTAILAGLQVYSWIKPNGAEVQAYRKQGEVALPFSYVEFLRNMEYAKAKELKSLSNLAAVQRSEDRPTYNPALVEALQRFADAPEVFSPVMDPEVVSVKIANDGKKTASNVKVFFPNPGFAEVTKDQKRVKAENIDGWIEVQNIEPGSQCLINLWTTRPFSTADVRVISDEGVVAVKPWPCETDRANSLIGIFGVIVALAGAAITTFAAWSFAKTRASLRTLAERSERG